MIVSACAWASGVPAVAEDNPAGSLVRTCGRPSVLLMRVMEAMVDVLPVPTEVEQTA